MSYDDNRELPSVLPGLDGDDGPMPPLSEPAANALTWRVVERWSRGAAAAPRELDGPASPLTAAEAEEFAQFAVRRHARKRFWRSFAAASLVLGVSGLAFGALRVWEAPASNTPDPTTAEAAPPRALRRAPRQAAPPAPETLAEPAPVPVPAPAPPSVPAAISDIPQLAVPTLARANALRAARAWQPAKSAYLQIAAGAAKPRERYVASVAAAALCLQHTGEPDRALALYAAALRSFPQGDLSEEIRLGTVHALRALERWDAEAVAVRGFLDHHPDSLNASAARERLRELTGEMETPAQPAP